MTLDKLKTLVPTIIDERLVPASDAKMRWVLGGAAYLIPSRLDDIFGRYLPTLQMWGLADDKGTLDVEKTEGFIRSAFAKSGKVPAFGFVFDATDGDYLIDLLKRNADG